MQASKNMSKSLERSHSLSWIQSNILNRTVSSRLYDDLPLQSLTQGLPYDSEYRHGYPKLYSCGMPAFEKPQDKTKFSFRIGDSRVVDRNGEIQRENKSLKGENKRLHTILENEKKNNQSQTELGRFRSIIATKTMENRRLQEKITVLERQLRQSGQSNQSGNQSSRNLEQRLNESQVIINQLNSEIRTMSARVSSSQNSQFQLQINQKNQVISDLERRLALQTPTIRREDSQVASLKQKILELEQKLRQEKKSQVNSRDDQQIMHLKQKIQELEKRLNESGRTQVSRDDQQQISELKQHIVELQRQLNHSIQAQKGEMGGQNVQQAMNMNVQQNLMDIFNSYEIMQGRRSDPNEYQGGQNNPSSQDQRTREDQQVISLLQKVADLEKMVGQGSSQNQDSGSSAQIMVLNQKIEKYASQISDFNTQIANYESRIKRYESQIQTMKEVATYSKLQVSTNSSNSSQLNDLKVKLERYQKQISLLEQANQVLEEKVVEFGSQGDRQGRGEGKNDEYGNSKDSLNGNGNISGNRDRDMNGSGNGNASGSKKQNRNRNDDSSFSPATDQILNSQWAIKKGKMSLRIIILLEEINRLKQKQLELAQKTEELHAYLLKAENYIEDVQSELQRNNLKENVPIHIVEKITMLEDENERYTLLIDELNKKLVINASKQGSAQSASNIDDDSICKIGKRNLRIIMLLEENNRLNHKVFEIRGYLTRAEDFIEQLQGSIKESATIIPPDIQNQLTSLNEENDKFKKAFQRYLSEGSRLDYSPEIEVKIAFLSQENNRLNKQLQSHSSQGQPGTADEEIKRLNNELTETKQFLVNAENYIGQCEARINEAEEQRSTQAAREVVKQVFGIPPEVEGQLSRLTQENQNLSRSLTQLQNRPARVQTRVEHKVEFRIPPELDEKIALLAQENEKLRLNQQQTSASSKKQPEFNSRQGELQLKSIILLQEINRLNFVAGGLRTHLIQAEDFIYQIENSQPQNGNSSLEAQATINHLSSENLKLSFEIKGLIANYEKQLGVLKDQISNYLTQINNYKLQITNCTTQINNYTTQINAYKNELAVANQTRSYSFQGQVQYRISPEIETRLALLASENSRLTSIANVKSGLDNVLLQADMEWGKTHLRAMILLEEINRLNHKVETIDAEREQATNHLMNAESYIQEIEAKYVFNNNQQ